MSEFVLHPVIPSLERDLVRDKEQVDELLCDYYAGDVHGALTDLSLEYNNPSVQFQYLLTLSRFSGAKAKSILLLFMERIISQ